MYFGGILNDKAILERNGQISTVDFVGCIRSISINGNEKNLFTESLNHTGLTNTCNFADACSKGTECGEYGTFFPFESLPLCSTLIKKKFFF